MTFFEFRQKASLWAFANAYNFLRISIGVIYIWFGTLKFFPQLSPAEELAACTIHELTFGFLPDLLACILLASWEVALGILLIFNLFKRFATGALIIHMVGTFSPLFLFPELSFTSAPYGLTLVGQYILKNLVIVCAAIVLMANSRQTAEISKRNDF